jgi:hypothetical protein
MNYTLENVYRHTGIYIMKKKNPRRPRLESSSGEAIHDVSTTTDELFRNLNRALHGISEHQSKLQRSPNGDAPEPAPPQTPKSRYHPLQNDQNDGDPKILRREPGEIIDLTYNSESEDDEDEMDIDELVDFAPLTTSRRLPWQPKSSVLTAETNSKLHSEKWKKEEVESKKVELKCDDTVNATGKDGPDVMSDTNPGEDTYQSPCEVAAMDASTAIGNNVRLSGQEDTADIDNPAEEPEHGMHPPGAKRFASADVDMDQVDYNQQTEIDVIKEVNEIYDLFEVHIQNIQAEISFYEYESVITTPKMDGYDKRTTLALEHFSNLFTEQLAFRDQIEEIEDGRLMDAVGFVVKAKETLADLDKAYSATRS